MNQISEGEGVTMSDYYRFMGPFFQKYMELKTDIPEPLVSQIKELAVQCYNDFKTNATPE